MGTTVELKPIRIHLTGEQTGWIGFNDGSKVEFDDNGDGNTTRIVNADGIELQPETSEYQIRDEMSFNVTEYEVEVTGYDSRIEWAGAN